MPTKPKLIEDLDWTTQRVSDRVWSISAGTIALALGYFVESNKAAGEPFLKAAYAAAPAAVALLSLMVDLAQYLAARRLQRNLLAEMEVSNIDALPFDKGKMIYKLCHFCFVVKVILCLIAAGLMTGLTTWRVVVLISGGK